MYPTQRVQVMANCLYQQKIWTEKNVVGVFIKEYPCNPLSLSNIVFDTLITLYTLQREN